LPKLKKPKKMGTGQSRKRKKDETGGAARNLGKLPLKRGKKEKQGTGGLGLKWSSQLLIELKM